MFQSGSEGLFFFFPLRCLLWAGESNTTDGSAAGRGLGWSGAGFQEAVTLLASLDTATNISLIPHVGPSTAHNLSGKSFIFGGLHRAIARSFY